MDPQEQSEGKKKNDEYLIKKCPECYTYLPLDAQVCTACQAKIREVDKLGFANRPVDWWGYLIAAVSIGGFVVYMWWAFFRE